MSDALDHELVLLIYHQLHKNISNIEDLTDRDIKMILIKTLQDVLKDVKIELIDSNEIMLIKENQNVKISLQKWVDKIKLLYQNYSPYFEVK
jgi:NADH dehydrogenase FAD-containing subunit